MDDALHAQVVPPTALPADVYLDRLEQLLRENARLRARFGQCLGVLEAIYGLSAAGQKVDYDFVEATVLPLVESLRTIVHGDA